jgi:photosystem II stability/assembly factor-like uncharacterized protein
LPPAWVQTAGPGASGINALLPVSGAILAGTATAGVFRSTDSGQNWQASNVGIEDETILALAGNPSFLFASARPDDQGHGGVFRSADGGQTWSLSNSGLEGRYILSLLAAGGKVFAGDGSFGVFRSIDNGASWQPANNGIGNDGITALAAVGSTVWAVGSNFIYFSTDGGNNWTIDNDTQYRNHFCLTAAGSNLYAGAFFGISRSTDSGANWTFIPIDFPTFCHVSAIAADGATLYAGTSGYPGVGIYKSLDNGSTWFPANNGIESVTINCLQIEGGRVLAGTPEKGLLASSDGGASWPRSNAGLPPGGNIRDLLVDGAGLLAATGGDGIYRTANAGVSWQKISNDPSGRLQSEVVASLAATGGVYLAGTQGSGVYRSTDAGAHWAVSNGGLPNPPQVLDLVAAGSNVIAALDGGIYYSTDVGLSWHASNITGFTVQRLAYANGFAYASVFTGVQDSGIYRSSNSGISWTLVLPSGFSTPASLAADGNRVYVGDLIDGMIRSDNNGINWVDITPVPGFGVFSILPREPDLYAGVQPGSALAYTSANHGASWTPIPDGLLPGTSPEVLAADASYLYLGSDQRAVWRRPFHDETAVAQGPADLPANLTLELSSAASRGSLEVRFGLPHSMSASLSLYDIRGARVARIADGVMDGGIHRRAFDGSRLASGVYLVRLEGGGEAIARKWVLVR